MGNKAFEDMTKKELAELAEDFGLDVVAASGGTKPTNAEYIDALNEFKDKQNIVHKDKPIKPKGLEAKISPIAMLKADAERKEYVLITDTRDAQTKDELVPVTWGNRAIKRRTTWVSIGTPTYVMRGALLNINGAPSVIHIAKEKGGVGTRDGKRFVVQSLVGLTKAEVAELATKQKMRNAKV